MKCGETKMEQRNGLVNYYEMKRNEEKNPAIGSDDVETYDSVESRKRDAIMEHMYPLLNSMRLFGLYFDHKKTSNSTASGSAAASKRSPRCSPAVAYGAFVVALLWLNVARMLSVFTRSDRLGPVMFGKTVGLMWMFLCAVLQTSYFVGSYTGSVQHVFELRHVTLTPHCAAYVRRMSFAYALIAWIWTLLNMAFFAYAIFFVDGYNDGLLSPFVTHIRVDDLFLVRVVTTVLCVYFHPAWCFPHAMTFLLATVVSHNFRMLDGRLRAKLDAAGGCIDGSDIEEVRQQHQEFCQIVSRADRFLRFANAAAFCGQLTTIILLLYTLIFYPSTLKDPVVLSMNLFWLTGGAVGLVLTAAGGIMVNNAAHQIFESVHCISLAGLNARTIGKINVFLNRLTGDQIGFTVLGIFVIDKNTILTLLGLLITYFLLVVELSNPAADSSSPAEHLMTTSVDNITTS